MKTVIAVAAVILSSAGAVCAQTLDDLKNDGKNPDNILTYGMGYAQNRYSPLAQINKSNIKRLVPVWTAGLENELGEQAQPIIHNGVMYVSNAKWTVALDALSGRQLGAPRSISRPKRRGWCAAACRTKVLRYTTAKSFARRCTRTSSRSTRKPARNCGSRKPRNGQKAIRRPSRR